MRCRIWRGLLPALVLSMVLGASAQESRRLSKEEEQRKFHPIPVRGMSAAERDAGYRQRLKLEADSVWSQLKWRSVGPEHQGGRVIEITAPSGNPNQVLVAFATGGLYRTEDDGITWTSLFDDQGSFGIGAVAVSRNGKTIWVGTGEANSQRTSYAGDGVYKSTDGGLSWKNMGLPESHHIGKILINPKDERVVWVAVTGHLYSQNPERGVYKTTDGGQTWQQVLKVDEYTGAISLVMDPRNPDVVFASMWDRDRRAWNFRESGKGTAVYRTSNAGRTWEKVTQLPTGFEAGRIGLAISESNPNVIYAYVDRQEGDPDWETLDERIPSGRLTPRRFLLLDEEKLLAIDKRVLEPFFRQHLPSEKTDDILARIKDKKLTFAQLRRQLEEASPRAFLGDEMVSLLYRSDDGGRSWRRTEVSNFGEFGGYYWGKVFVDPKDPNDVYVLGVPLIRSQDGGKTWESIARGAHVDHHAMWFDPRNTDKVWIGNDGGPYISYDGGVTVRHLNNLAVGQTTTLAVDNENPYNIITGLQDNGTIRGPSRQGRGTTWESVGGGDGSAVAIDPRDSNLIYIASQFGAHRARNLKTGESWNARPSTPRGDPEARFNWISPLILSPHHADIVYCGAQRLYRSMNQGRSYVPISPDLTKNRPNGDVPHSTIKEISESPLRFGLIYVGCDDGNVQMTHDGGYQWQLINTPEPEKWVSRVIASKFDLGTVYLAQNGYREDDFAPYLWKSSDFGKTWKSIVGNLPAEPINVVREDPSNRNMLYVGTDMGVYVTFDGGSNWETLHGGIPNTPVHDLVVQEREKDLVIASHGRSIWILPMQWLYDLTPEIRKKGLHLFAPDTVRRTPSWGYERRQRWQTEEPEPPTMRGTFYVNTPGAAAVRIRDKDGKVVKEKSVDATKGLNFFEVDLVVSPAQPASIDPDRKIQKAEEALLDPLETLRAKFLPVGDYTLEIEVNGKRATEAWKIVQGSDNERPGRGGGEG